MRITGFQKLTLVDYPEKLACILFTAGCNMRCPYCHNSQLVLCPDAFPAVPDEEIFSYLDERKKILDGVVISGGEPTIHNSLYDYILRIKEYGLLVKLDTNGTNPDVIRRLVESRLVDYVAMDVKNSLDSYSETVGISSYDTTAVKESIEYLKEGHVDYEFRTTVTKETHSEKNFHSLASLLEGSLSYYIQNFVPNENTMTKGLHPLTRDELETYIGILRKRIENEQVINT